MTSIGTVLWYPALLLQSEIFIGTGLSLMYMCASPSNFIIRTVHSDEYRLIIVHSIVFLGLGRTVRIINRIMESNPLRESTARNILKYDLAIEINYQRSQYYLISIL